MLIAHLVALSLVCSLLCVRLNVALNLGAIFVGQKLRIVSATLGGATDAVTPLEAHTAYLKL